MGASLIPDFYRIHVNLAVMTGPVACTANIPNPIIRFAASKIKELQFLMVHELHMYNWWGEMPLATEALSVFCEIMSDLCIHFSKILHHDGVDNGERFSMYMSEEPAGISYRTFVYYAQMINSGRMALYDYGVVENKKLYGTSEPPLLPMEENYVIPTALFSGSMDGLADPEDVANLAIALGDNLVLNK
jgi:lysosomal acid lipase/cholesteryl ester hydrolase